MKITPADNSKLPLATPEYLRRNLLHCSAVGVHAGIVSAIRHLTRLKNRPVALVKKLMVLENQARVVHEEMAQHRDEVSSYRKDGKR